MINPIKINLLSRLLAVAAAGFAPPAFAVDLLDLPAVQSPVASRVQLLDVTKRGDDSYVAVGEHGVVVLSNDGGVTWTQASVPSSVTLTAVDFPTPESGWAVGHDGLILHSSDGGMTWQKQLDGNELNEQIIPVAERIVEKYHVRLTELEAQEDPDPDELDEAQFMSEEAEFMLEGAQDDVDAGPVRPLLDVWFRDDREGLVAGSYGMLLHTADGGKTWELVSDRMDNPQAFHLNEITPAPDGTLFIAGEAGRVFRSSDGGLTWQTLEPGYEGSFYGVLTFPRETGGYSVLAYGLRGTVFLSEDLGESWEEVDPGTSVTIATGTLLRDGTVFLAGQGGLILTLPAGERSFKIVNNPDRRVIAGAVQLKDGNVLLVGLGGVRETTATGGPIQSESTAQ